MVKTNFSIEITKRFLEAIDYVIANNEITAYEISATVGMSAGNLSRLRTSDGKHNVTIEAIGLLCEHYKISPYWLVTGKSKMDHDDEMFSTKTSLKKSFAELKNLFKDLEGSFRKLSAQEEKGSTKTHVPKGLKSTTSRT